MSRGLFSNYGRAVGLGSRQLALRDDSMGGWVKRWGDERELDERGCTSIGWRRVYEGCLGVCSLTERGQIFKTNMSHPEIVPSRLFR